MPTEVACDDSAGNTQYGRRGEGFYPKSGVSNNKRESKFPEMK